MKYRISHKTLKINIVGSHIVSFLIVLFLLLAPLQGASGQFIVPEIGKPAATDSQSVSLDFSGCTRQDISAVDAYFEQRVVELVNEERAKYSLPPLKSDSDLQFAARYHSADMMQDNYFNHDSYDRKDGSLVFICGVFTRMKLYYPVYSALGENIAAGFGTPEAVMDAWMNSDGHRANILSSNYREIGAGFYKTGGTYGTYWTQDFGSNPQYYPVVINREKAVTDTAQVSLYTYGTGVWTEMRVRNNDGDWSDWGPFQANRVWALDWVAGTQMVSVELRNSTTTTSSSDTITLTTSEPASPELGNLPDSLRFIYIVNEDRLVPDGIIVQPLNVTTSDPLSWTVSTDKQWIDLSPLIGISPTSKFLVEANDDGSLAIGQYSGVVTVSLNSPLQVAGDSEQIIVYLTVVKEMNDRIYLPSIIR